MGNHRHVVAGDFLVWVDGYERLGMFGRNGSGVMGWRGRGRSVATLLELATAQMLCCTAPIPVSICCDPF